MTKVTPSITEVKKGETLTFSATLARHVARSGVVYHWTVSGGEIQGSDSGSKITVLATGEAGEKVTATCQAENEVGLGNEVSNDPEVNIIEAVLDPITATIVFTPSFIQLPDETQCTCKFINPTGGAGAPYTVSAGGGGWGLDNYLGGEQIDHDTGIITGIDTAGDLIVSVVIEDKDGNRSELGAITRTLEVRPAPAVEIEWQTPLEAAKTVEAGSAVNFEAVATVK